MATTSGARATRRTAAERQTLVPTDAAEAGAARASRRPRRASRVAGAAQAPAADGDGAAAPARRAARPRAAASRERSARLSEAVRAVLRFEPAAAPERVSEEEAIESSKYAAGPSRRFEEERFRFPESYGVNRVRLLAKDPAWLFAHWDVDVRAFDELRRSLGERVAALSRLTLRVHDALSGGSSVVLLPFGARSWYVRGDTQRRSYRADLGITLPSGEFRLLAESNTVVMPRGEASPRTATRRQRYVAVARGSAAAVRTVAQRAERTALARAGRWEPPPHEAPAHGAAQPARGGASDLHRPALGGASDLHRARGG